MPVKKNKNQLSIFDNEVQKKKPTAKQLAARAKFTKMVKAKAAAKKSTIKKSTTVKQRGTSVKKIDKLRQALPPGIRVSQKTGKPYKEVRANRSDKGVLLGVEIKKQNIKKFILDKYNNEYEFNAYYKTQIFEISQIMKQPEQKGYLKEWTKLKKDFLLMLKESNYHIKELKKLL